MVQICHPIITLALIKHILLPQLYSALVDLIAIKITLNFPMYLRSYNSCYIFLLHYCINFLSIRHMNSIPIRTKQRSEPCNLPFLITVRNVVREGERQVNNNQNHKHGDDIYEQRQQTQNHQAPSQNLVSSADVTLIAFTIFGVPWDLLRLISASVHGLRIRQEVVGLRQMPFI